MAAITPAEIPWSEPILPEVDDPAFFAEVKAMMGSVPDYMRRVAPSPWIRKLCLNMRRYRFMYLSPRYAEICFLVASQENSCRYCFGAARAMMRLLGYDEDLTSRIEREAQLAELDEKERAFIQFTRNLARSNPRPGRMAREQLMALGYPAEVIAEMAFMIATNCVGNRITTLMACRPEAGLEKFSTSWMARLMRPILRYQLRKLPPAYMANGAHGISLSGVADVLKDVPTAAALMQESLDDAFASELIPRPTKALMFGVVARALECDYCEGKVTASLGAFGFSPEEVQSTLMSLDSPKLDPDSRALVSWVRDTVRYTPHEVQKRTRALLEQVGPEKTLEAIGVAALANGAVRIAMLHT